jgi:hypothetical protein
VLCRQCADGNPEGRLDRADRTVALHCGLRSSISAWPACAIGCRDGTGRANVVSYTRTPVATRWTRLQSAHLAQRVSPVRIQPFTFDPWQLSQLTGRGRSVVRRPDRAIARRSARKRRSSAVGFGGTSNVNPQLQLRQRTCQTSSSCCSGSIASGS